MIRSPHSFAERFIHGNILARLWSLVAIGVSLATSFLTLAALSVRDFGVYQLVLSAAAFVDVFAVTFFDEVVQNDISRSLSEGKKNEAKRLFRDLALVKIMAGFIAAVILFLGAEIIARYYDRDIAGFVRIVSLVVVFRPARYTADLFLRSVVSLRAVGSTTVEELIKLGIIAGLFFFSVLGIREVLLATAIGVVVSFLYTLRPFLREYRAVFRGIPGLREAVFFRVVKTYGLLLLFRSAAHKAAKPLRPWLIGGFIGAEAVALYALAANLVAMIKDLFPQLGSSLLAWEIGNVARLRYIFSRSMKYSLWAGVALGLVSFFVVPPLIGSLFPKYLPAMSLFYFLLLSVPLHGISRLEYALLTALREQKLLVARLFVEIALSTVILVFFLPFLGILAVGVEVNAAIVWRLWFLYRKTVQKYPYLRLNFRSFFRIDAEDRLIFRRGVAEVLSFLRRRRQAVP